jgi:hypothetical protein
MRNLADQCPDRTACLLQPCTSPMNKRHELAFRLDIVDEVGPERCCQEKSQAASCRIHRKSNPNRHRKCDRTSHRDQAESHRKEDQPCKHFAQPPREDCNKFARPAWRDCGRVWAILRLVATEVFFRGPSATLPQHLGLSREMSFPTRAPRLPAWAGRRRSGRDLGERRDLFGRPAQPRRMPSVNDTMKGLCEIDVCGSEWRALAERAHCIAREYCEACLSFVMPQQQSEPPADDGDAN